MNAYLAWLLSKKVYKSQELSVAENRKGSLSSKTCSQGSRRAGFGWHDREREEADDRELTLTPMNLSLRTIHDSKKTKALLQQNSTETSVALIFFIACKYR